LWFKTEAHGNTYGTLLGKHGNGQTFDEQGVDLGMRNGTIYFHLTSVHGSNFIRVKTNRTNLNDNKFHHVAVSYDGSSKANGVSIFIDGTKTGVTVDHNSLTKTTRNVSPFIIGARSDDYSYFDGAMDEIRIWKAIRTDTEISQNYKKELDGSQTNLILYYKLDDYANSIVDDCSQSGLDGEKIMSPNFDTTSYAPLTTDVKCGTSSSHDFATEDLSVFPNPFNKEITVDVVNEGIVDVLVINCNGQVVYSDQFLKTRVIDLGYLTNGIYTVRLKTHKGVTSRRLIKF